MSGRTPRNGQDNIARASNFRDQPGLVMQKNNDPDWIHMRQKDPTGEAESLRGYISLSQMGDRAQHTAPPLEKTSAGRHERTEQRIVTELIADPSPTTSSRSTKKRRRGVLEAAAAAGHDDQCGGSYVPQTRETRTAFDALLALVLAYVGDEPRDVVRGMAEDVLAVMKGDRVPASERQRAVSEVLGEVSMVPGAAQARMVPAEVYNEIVQLCGGITDWVDPTISGTSANAAKGEDEGISVVLEGDEESNDEENDDDMGDDSEDEDDDESSSAASSVVSSESEDDNNGEGDGAADDGKEEVAVKDVDAYWLQREMHAYESDAGAAQDIAERAFEAMVAAGDDDCAAEGALLDVLGYERMRFVAKLLRNRRKIVWCMQYGRAQNDADRRKVLAEIAAAGADGAAVARELNPHAATSKQTTGTETQTTGKKDAGARQAAGKTSARETLRQVDLDAAAFSEGGHVMSNTQCRLPPGSYKAVRKGYEEIHIPRPPPDTQARTAALVPITALPEWARVVFPEHVRELNYVQSTIFDSAFGTRENMLVCAPTGAGKTICSMLTMLAEIAAHVDEETGEVDLSAFKIVYVAPMKSLVQEMAGNFAKRFEPLHITVRELSGDASLTRREIAEAQVIVTTPEKWDVVTRKPGGGAGVGLLVLDEVHLLHDARGAVLEALVARVQRQQHSRVRLVGLSATLPNHADVAQFLDVSPAHVHVFGAACRPVPLEQTYIGVAEKRPARRERLMNEVTYDLVSQRAGRCQVLVFVHSRKETVRTARYIRDAAVAAGQAGCFVRDAGSRGVLTSEAENIIAGELRDLVTSGVGVHHAGLARDDRRLVEDLFAAGHLQVLVSTATLAWGVNLPAHTVIVRGTQVYSAERGRWVELGPLDVLQMIGRAGRPQYDTEGEGIVITTQDELQYYLSLLNQQLPVESQLIARLPDLLNAEVVLGSIRSVADGVRWLQHSYLHVRMLCSPALYGVPVLPDSENTDSGSRRNGSRGKGAAAGGITDDSDTAMTDGKNAEDDRDLYKRVTRYETDLIHSAAAVLERHGLVRYDRRTGVLETTALGRVASHYYVTHASVAAYNELLRPAMGDVELLRLFSASHEFTHMPVRAEEAPELARLAERVPVPIRERADDPKAKVNVLLQAYISRLPLTGTALASDMVLVTQSAGRITRALFEIARHRGWASLAQRCLALCAMVERRLWLPQTPLRQLAGGEASAAPPALIRRLERLDASATAPAHLVALTSRELGALVRDPASGRTLYQLVHALPRMDVEVASVRPLTRAMLQIDIVLKADFEFDASRLRAPSVAFWVTVEDVDGARLLHQQRFVLKERLAGAEHVLTATVPVLDPLPPLYYVRCVADRWIGCSTTVPVVLRNLRLPERFPPPTELHDTPPVRLAARLTALQRAAVADGEDAQTVDYTRLIVDTDTVLNPLQTQAFHTLFDTDASTLICAPPASGTELCAELAIIRAWSTLRHNQRATAAGQQGEPQEEAAGRRKKGGKRPVHRAMVYVAPCEAWAEERCRAWRERLTPAVGIRVAALTGDAAADARILERVDLVVATAAQWERVSRRWRSRRAVQQVCLFVVDGLETLGDGAAGAALEVVVSRMRCVSAQKDASMRIVGLATALADARDVAEWIGAGPQTMFNFHPGTRPHPLELRLVDIDHADSRTRLAAMVLPAVDAVRRTTATAPTARAIVFVPSRHDAVTIARELILTQSDALSNTSNADIDGFTVDVDGDDSEQKNRKDGFLNITAEELEHEMGTDVESGLQRELLHAGVGVLWDGMAQRERQCVERLFAAGAAQVVVATHEQAWAMGASLHANSVVVVSTEAYNAGEHRCTEYPASELLQMTGLACLPGVGSNKNSPSQCTVLCDAARRDYYKRFLREPLPVESQLPQHLHDTLNAEVAAGTIESLQDGVDYLTWTLLYRRLQRNPAYYELTGTTSEHLSSYLSDLIESTLADLDRAHCVALDTGADDDAAVDDETGGSVRSLNLGTIAAHYGVTCDTIELFAASLTARTRTRGVIDLLAAATEFATLPVRRHEAAALARTAAHLPLPVPAYSRDIPGSNSGKSDDASHAALKSSHAKAHVLIQAHLIRAPLPPELLADQRNVLARLPTLLHALVDVANNACLLATALAAMELSQLTTQALWRTDSELLQLPHFSRERAAACTKRGVSSVYDMLDLDASSRAAVLDGLAAPQIRDVALVCNAFPDVSLSLRVNDTEIPSDAQDTVSLGVVAPGENVALAATLTSGDDDEEGDGTLPRTPVHAPLFPGERFAEWWVVVGDVEEDKLVRVRRLSLTRTVQQTELEFKAPETPGPHTFRVTLMSDSYVGCDRECSFSVVVSAANTKTEVDDGDGDDAGSP